MSKIASTLADQKRSQKIFLSTKSCFATNQKQANHFIALANQSSNKDSYQLFTHPLKHKIDYNIYATSKNMRNKHSGHNMNIFKKLQRAPVSRGSSFENKINQLRKKQSSILQKQGNITESKQSDLKQKTIGSKPFKRARRNNSTESIAKDGRNDHTNPEKQFLATGSTCGVKVNANNINWSKSNRNTWRKASLDRNAGLGFFQQSRQYLKISMPKDSIKSSQSGSQAQSPLRLQPKLINQQISKNTGAQNSFSHYISSQRKAEIQEDKDMMITNFKSQFVQSSKEKEESNSANKDRIDGRQSRSVSNNYQRKARGPITIEAKALIDKAKRKGQFNQGKYQVKLINFFDPNFVDPNTRNTKQMALSSLNKFYDFCLKTLQKNKVVPQDQKIQECQRQRYQQLVALTQSLKTQKQKKSNNNLSSFSHRVLLEQLYPMPTALQIKSFKRYAQKQQNNDKLGKINQRINQKINTQKYIEQKRPVTSGGNANHIYIARSVKRKQNWKDMVKKKSEYDDVGAWQISVAQQL